MPVRYTKSTPDYPNKRPRLENKSKSKSSFIFTNASQIRASLRQDDPEALTEALTSLRNQLSVKQQEEHDHAHTAISPTDERLTLAKEWMETSPGAQDLFAIWDNSPTHPNSNSNSRSPSSPLTPLILTLLSSLLTLLSAHYPLHPLGHPILRTLLAPARLRTLNAFLGGANNELIITTLRLYNAMSNWAGGRRGRRFWRGLGGKLRLSLPKLLNMRRKTHGERDLTDPLIRPDIRTLYILLLLSFLSPSTPSPIKSLFLEHHRPAFIAIFKGLAGDHYALVRRVLETCWTGVWCDPRVKRSVGVAVFGEGVLGCLVKLYDRNVPENPPSTTPPSKKDHQEQEDGEEEREQEQEQEQEPQIPADLVHHFLLAICTRPGTGICFKDRGWYPRSSDSEGTSEGAFEGRGSRKGKGSRIYNKILANFVKTLKVNEDPRQQELVLKILEACPELVLGYWSSIGLTLEPRLSSKWITNIAVFGSIVSLPVPVDTFLLPGSTTTASTTAGSAPSQRQYNPTPPPLSTILANILPTQSVKQNLTKGLLPSSSGHAQAQVQAKSGAGQTQTQSPTLGLTQHLTALALCRCLLKYDAVMREMRRVSEALEEEEDAGVGMDFDGGVETGEGQSRGREGQWARRMREVEREVRRRVPEWGVCVGFAMGVGVGVGAGGNTPNVIAPAPMSNPTKTALLAESAQRLLWLYHRCLPSVVAEVRFDVGKLLQTFVQGPSSSAAREDEDEEMQGADEEEEEPDAASRLYRVQQLHILGLLKQSDQFVWSTKIPSLSQTPFHVLLTALSNSGCTGIGTGNSTSSTAIRKASPTSCNAFSPKASSSKKTLTSQNCEMFEDTVQHLLCLCSGPTSSSTLPQILNLKHLPSPLLMTLLEQLEAKTKTAHAHASLPASHLVGIAVYMRKLIFNLAGKTPGALEVLRAVVDRLDGALSSDRLSGYEEKEKEKGVKLDVRITFGSDQEEKDVVEEDVTGAGDVTAPDVQAYLDHIETNPIRARRVIVLDRSVLDDGVQNLIPGRGQVDLWAALDLDLPGNLDFPYLFLHSTSRHITDEACQSVLAQSIFPASPSSRSEIKVKLVDITRCIYLIAHRLSSVLRQEHRGQEERRRTRILERSQEVLSSPEDTMLLKEVVFLHAGVVKDVMMSSALGGDEGIQRLIDASLDPAVEGDRRMVADISGYWFNVLTQGQGQGQDLDSSAESVPIALACLWVKFLSPERLFDLLDVVQREESRNQNGVRPSVSVLRPIEVVLEALCVAASAPSSSSSNGGQEGPGPGQEEQEGCDTETLLLERLPQLLALRSSFMRDSVLLEQVLAIAVQAALPIGLDGCLPVVMSSSSSSSAAAAAPGHMDLVHLTQRAEGRWATRHHRHHRRHSSRCGRSDVNMDVDNVDLDLDLDIRPFLFQPTYSQWTVKIICALIYQQSNSNSNSNSTSLLRDVLREWLGSSALQRPVEHVLPIVYAFLDSGGFLGSQDEETEGAEGDEGIKTTVDDELWTPFVPILVRTLGAQDVPAEQHRQAQASLLKMVSSIADLESSTALEVLERECRALPEKNVTPALLCFGVGLHTRLGGKSKSKVEGVLAVLIERGIKACIDHFGDALVTVEGSRVAVALTALLRRARVAKAHLVETLLTVTIQSRFANVVALRLATACLSACQLKPVVVNRHLQSIIQHPYFFKICSSSSSSSSSNSNASLEHGETREALIGLLHHLFTLHPTNTCQITHIEPLIRVYGGTLSLADRRVLSVFGLFERERKVSVTPLLSRWSADGAGRGDGVSQTALEALQSLDPILVLRTTLNFPRWRRLGDQLLGVDVDGASAGAGIGATADEAVLYDPIFLMLLFGQMLSDHPPTSAIGWIELFRTNVVSLFIRALSAKDGRMRELALSQVVGVWRHMETADLQEQPHVMHILNLLKDLMPAPSTSNSPSDSDPEYPRRLPTYTSLLLMHSLRAIFHPSQFIYPHTARFLLQRPSLDVSDVPMLYGLLYSSSDENMGWKKERAWMMRFLADGMSALEGRDGPLRMGILEVLANLTCNAQATTSLILKSALLQWIEMQLLYSTTKAEGVEWIKILENILVIVDASKLEVATNGDWRYIICRCLACLLDQKSCATASDNFFHAVPVILRLASLPGPALRDLPSLLDLAVTINAHQTAAAHRSTATAPLSYPSSTLSDVITSQPLGQEQLFIALLEMLWKASMLIQNRSDAWEKLTARMLLWNSVRFTADLGADADVDVNVAEWARKEVIFNVRSQGRVE
ncbi:ribosome 60S biogenesis N-terminal-domain-containing protein [Gymnopilus junonius]|uniref:Ribosome 60S biogenesis N-terminal-domain-containing protein n=1 Tax=Gymnopilus junonius TaxID=109634 RepID=A0A9P5NR20_GYMJU|nr:ribosome 60S biogenesis N-terminal-domain-containing protein [Gymnopilus junonius]